MSFLTIFRWSAIAARLPERTDNEIKNYWNTHIRKKLLRMGIDPVTHNPRLDLLDLNSIFNPSLYNSSQVMNNNLSRLLGVQSLVNPNILKLANSLLSSHHQNQNFLLQSNFQENQLCNSHVQNQVTPSGQASQIQNPIQNILTCFDLNTSSVSFYNDTLIMEQSKMEPSTSSILNFSSQNCQQNFTFDSILPTLSTPSSTPTSLNSNSSTISEEERESYCSMLNFDVPNILDINEFM